MLLAQHAWQRSQQTAGKRDDAWALCSLQDFGNSLVPSLCTHIWLHPSHPSPTWLSLLCGSNSAAAEHFWARGKLSETYLVQSEQEVPSVAFYEKCVQGREGVNCKIQLCQASDNTGSKRLSAPSYSASTLRQHLIQQLFEAVEKALASSWNSWLMPEYRLVESSHLKRILSLKQKDFLHGGWES